MLKKIIRLSILLFLYSSYILLAQSPNLYHITEEQGLPSMTVYDIMQDKEGYIWLGTEAGICKYDGYKFEILDVPKSKGKAFTLLSQDQTGKIYFMNFNNQLFYIFQNKVYEVSFPKEAQKYRFKEYIIDHENNIWIVSGDIYQYNAKNKQAMT